MTRLFSVDLGWGAILAELKARRGDVLRRAKVPEDLFSRVRPTLSAPDFFRLWQEMMHVVGGDTPGLTLAQSLAPKDFNPPMFAALCSPNLTCAVERLSLYKPLIGPICLEVHDTLGGLEITYEAETGVTLPDEFICTELACLVDLARTATGAGVRPIAVEMVHPPPDESYKAFFGRPVRKGPFNRVVFAREDAKAPFQSPLPAIFAPFERDLRVRLDELDRAATMKERVRAVLMEGLPSGQGDTAAVAGRLGISTRGLQRKLAAEGTSFQAEVRILRTRLAEKYLRDTGFGSSEIAFLLGFGDPNSFIRAFHTWSGTTPEAFRSAARTGLIAHCFASRLRRGLCPRTPGIFMSQ